MKVIAEYDLITTAAPPVQLYKHSSSRSVKINQVHYKPQSKYVEIDCMLHKDKTSAYATRAHNIENTLTFTSVPIQGRSLFYGKICHEKKTILLRKIDLVYLFEPKFSSLDTYKEKSGLEFRKAESRKEQKHRKMNINYQLKIMEDEKFVDLTFVSKGREEDEPELVNNMCEPTGVDKKSDNRQLSGEVNPFMDIKTVDTDLTSISNLTEKIKGMIINAKVVNVDVLMKYTRRADLIKDVLSKVTIKRAGRYFLSNAFYSSDIHEIRKKLIDVLESKEYVVMKDIEAFIQHEHFLIDELCYKKGTKYFLKGHRENCQNSVLDVLKEKGICSLKELSELTSMSMHEIKTCLSVSDVLEFPEQYYALDEKDGSPRSFVLDLLNKKATWKRSEVAKLLDKCLDATYSKDEIFTIFDTFCDFKKLTWSLRKK